MRKSLFGAGSAPQRPGALRTRNSNVENTPKNRQSGGSVRKSYLPQVDSGKRGNPRQSVTQKRISSEGLSRISLAGGSRYTPTRRGITPTRPSTSASSNNLQPNNNRLSIESARSSSIGGRSVRKESRPLNDPKFKSICIDKILEFLKCNGYESQIVRRNLLTPTTKDFVNIFNFIYRYLDNSYQLPAKFEDEIPKLLKKCKYPVQMSKSSFITVGSPHTWPAVLAMLSWMVDVVNIYSSVEPVSQAFPEDFEVALNKEKCKFQSMVACVNAGPGEHPNDACNLELERYRHILEEHEQVRPQDMIKVQEEEDRLDQELKNLTIGPERLQNLEHQYHQIIDDKEKLDSYCGDLRAIISKKDAEVSALSAELSQLKEEYLVISSEIQRLTAFQEEQDLDAAMLVRLKNHAADVKALITQMHTESKDLDSQIWNFEMELSKAQKSLQESVHSYNSNIQQLELGDDFKVSAVGVAENLHNWENKLLNSLRTFKKSAKQNLFQSQTNKQRVEEEKCTVHELLQDKQINMNKLELKMKRLEDTIQMTKNEIAQEEQEMREECEQLVIQVTEANRVHKGSSYQKQCALDKSKEKLSQVKIYGRDRMKNGADFLVKVCKRSLEHAEFISRETVKSKLTIEHMVLDATRSCKD